MASWIPDFPQIPCIAESGVELQGLPLPTPPCLDYRCILLYLAVHNNVNSF